FLGAGAKLDSAFLAAVALGAAATVLLATRLGLPISTTHALAGSLVGSGLWAVGGAGLNWTLLATVLVLPLLVSPLVAMGLTYVASPRLAGWLKNRSCLCMTQPAPHVVQLGNAAAATPSFFPALRIAHRADCERGDELTRWNTEEIIHWSSAGLISFSRGLNDSPKIAALALAAGALAPAANYFLVASVMALGGLAAARRVARTMSQGVTQIEPVPGLSANLAGALLVGVASPMGLPVSTTHVTLGGIFGLGLRRRQQTHWSVARQIVMAWLITLPLGMLSGLGFYFLLTNFL
ncbi:MAG: inorganic phosphate transporter, partial [Candidatus Acidiferrales bacterium]